MFDRLRTFYPNCRVDSWANNATGRKGITRLGKTENGDTHHKDVKAVPDFLRVKFPPPVAKMSPLALPLSQQLRLRRLFGSTAYDEAHQLIRIELDGEHPPATVLMDLLRDFVPVDQDVAVTSDR